MTSATEALIRTVHHIGPAVVLTTIVLALGLGVSVALLSTIEPGDYDVLEVIPLGHFLPPLYMSIATVRGRPPSAAVECFLQVLRADLQG